MESIVHLCSAADWEQANTAGMYRADSLATEGFIHCSRPKQVIGVGNRYYAGHQDLILLWINTEKLSAELRWEDSDGDVYPHLYGALNLDAVERTTPFQPDDDGVFRKLT